MKWQSKVTTVCVVVTLVANAASSVGQDFVWSAPAGGNWDDAFNWDGETVPEATGEILIRPDFGGTIQGPIGFPVFENLTLASDSGRATLEIRGDSTFALTGQALIEGSGKLYIPDRLVSAQGGVVNVGEIEIRGGMLNGGQVQSSGLIRGFGEFGASVINSGRLEILDEQEALVFGEDIHNTPGGLVAIRESNIRIHDGLLNEGAVSIGDGTVDFFANVTNDGTVGLSSGAIVSLVGDLAQNGTVNLITGSRLVVFGSFAGTGGTTGGGTLEVLGALSVGNSPAAVSFGGDVALGGSSGTFIEVAGLDRGQFDAIEVAGSISLAGELEVSLLDDFVPMAGDSFEVVTATGGISGEFTGMSLPDLGSLLKFEVAQKSDSLLLSVVPQLTGDFDANGLVDGSDFLDWQRADGTPEGLSSWEASFGTSTATAVGVPEPASVVILSLGFLLVQLHRRRYARPISGAACYSHPCLLMIKSVIASKAGPSFGFKVHLLETSASPGAATSSPSSASRVVGFHCWTSQAVAHIDLRVVSVCRAPHNPTPSAQGFFALADRPIGRRL